MTERPEYTHPQDQLLLQKEPVLKTAGPVLSCFEAVMAFFVFLICCAIMYHIVT